MLAKSIGSQATRSRFNILRCYYDRKRSVCSHFINGVSSRSSKSKRVVDMASADGELRVFMVAGEVSGDSIGSRLMASLKNLSPLPVRFAGVGGFVLSPLFCILLLL